MNPITIYFLCTGNSCRSQMAEGFGKSILGEFANVYSAGIEAHGINPRAIKVMKEAGIDISNQTSNTIDDTILQNADYIITLCGNAKDRCPVVKSDAKRLHWDLEDPADAKGAEDKILAVFRTARDDIKTRIQDLKNNLIPKTKY